MSDSGSSDSDDSEVILTSPDTLQAETKLTDTGLPEKSRKRYEKCYQEFIKWKKHKKATSFSEDVLLAYFQELSVRLKCSSLWSKYSMIKSTLSIYNEIDISEYSKLIAFIKAKAKGYERKKPKTFSSEQLNKFLNDAPDELYLSTKVALIFGIFGACESRELYYIRFKDVEVIGSAILVKIYKKTEFDRSFTVTGKHYNTCMQYIKLRPNPCNCPWFFLQYQMGKCIQQRIGRNKFGVLVRTIANYLHLPDPGLYTGNCFRNTSTTLIVEAAGDCDLESKSAAVAKSCMRNTILLSKSVLNLDVMTKLNSILNCTEDTKNEINDNMTKPGNSNYKASSPTIPVHNSSIQNGKYTIQLKKDLDSNILDDVEQSVKTLITESEETNENTNRHDTNAEWTSSTGDHCKVCSTRISGFLYRCMVCVDYEFCGECEGRGTELHHDNHYVLRVPATRPTGEVEQVELAVRQALASIPSWQNTLNTKTPNTGKRKKSVNAAKKTGKGKSTVENETFEKENILHEEFEVKIEPIDLIDEASETDGTNEISENELEPEIKSEFPVKLEPDPLEVENRDALTEETIVAKLHQHDRDPQHDNVRNCQPNNVRDCQLNNVRDCQPNNVRDCQPNNVRDCQPNNVRDCQPNNVRDCQLNNVRDCQPNNVRDCQPNNVRDCQPNNVRDCQPNNVRDPQHNDHELDERPPPKKRLMAITSHEKIMELNALVKRSSTVATRTGQSEGESNPNVFMTKRRKDE